MSGRLEKFATLLVVLAVATLGAFTIANLLSSSLAVDLLENRTPLFDEIEIRQSRNVCIAEHEAAVTAHIFDGLSAVAANDTAALADAIEAGQDERQKLSDIGTELDPCPRLEIP